MTIMGESLSDVLNAFAAGLAGAAISKTAVAPLDRTKLLLQTQVCNYSVMSGEVERFSGGLGTMVRVAKEQGVTALWRGNTTDVLRYAPTHAFNFLFRDWFSLFMPDLDPVTQPYKRAGAELFVGGAAGVSALVLLHPFDVVRTRLATDLGKGYTRQYRGLIDCTSKTLKLGGPIHGLYCGFWVTVPSVMIFRAIYLGGYAIGKENFLPEDSGFTSKFLLAQTVTTLGGLAAYPLDTVRRRVILQPGAKEVLYKNGRDCLRRILADEGPRALYHGATVNILRSTTSALVLVIYDSLRSALGGQEDVMQRRSWLDRRESDTMEDMAWRLQGIHTKMLEKIQEIKKSRPRSKIYSNNQYAMECGASKWVNQHSVGLPFDTLLDLKMLFEGWPGEGGFPEQEFVECFGPVFCPSSDPTQMKTWFMTIDQDANGHVDWDEFSSYLMKTTHGPTDNDKPTLYITRGISPEVPSSAQSAINKITCNPLLGEYYTAGSDGTVRRWDSLTLRDKGIIHHGDGSMVHSLHYLPETNRLVVGQFDRLTFIYSCGSKTGSKQGPSLQRAFKGQRITVNDLKRTNRIVKTCEYDPDSKIMEERGSGYSSQMAFMPDKSKKISRLGRHHVDVVLMDDLNKNVLCMESMHSLCSERYSDPFIMGLEEGNVQLYNLALREESNSEDRSSAITVQHLEPGAKVRCIEKWKPHTDWVTHMLVAPQLQGFISSSLDNSIQVLDITKGKSYLRMEVDGDDARRGVHFFDYTPQRNLLCSCGISRNAIVWNPKARQKMCTLTEHRAALVAVKFVDKNSQLITLSEDKILKVWDIRTFRCIQTLTDKERRYPEDKCTGLGYDPNTSSILACSGTPVVWRDINTQAELESGTSWHANYQGHLAPIVGLLFSVRMKQVLTCDERYIHVWDVNTGDRLAKWSPFDISENERVTALCFDGDQRRLLIGCDDGDVSMWSLNGKKLKTFVSHHSDMAEVVALLHVVTHPGQSQSQSYVVSGGHGKKCLVWQDLPIPPSMHRVAEGRGVMSLSTQNAAVHSIAFFPPNKIAVGTAVGTVLLYNLNNMSLLSVNKSDVSMSFKTFEADEVKPEDLPAPQHRPSMNWKKLCNAAGSEQQVPGAHAFTKFRTQIQTKLLEVTEAVVSIDSDMIVTLHGDGDALVWKIRDSHFLEITACFPASYAPGEVAYVLDYDKDKQYIYVGDGNNIISIFDIGQCLRDCRDQGQVSKPATTRTTKDDKKTKKQSNKLALLSHTFEDEGRKTRRSPSGRVYHNRTNVKLIKCFSLQQPGVITQMQVLPSSSVLVVASNDSGICVVSKTTGQIYAKFGSVKEYPGSWPEGLPHEVHMGCSPVYIEPASSERWIPFRHRFCYIFPDSVGAGSDLVNSLLDIDKACNPQKYEEESDFLDNVANNVELPALNISSEKSDLFQSTDSLETSIAKNAAKYLKYRKKYDGGQLVDECTLPVQRSSSDVEAHLKQVQQRKKQITGSKHFAYTTVRQLRSVKKPLFGSPMTREQCNCQHCKTNRGREPEADYLPLFN